MTALVATADEASLVGHLGPDPLRDDWDPDEAVRRLRAAGDRPVVSALLDQTVVAGLGNLWVNELAFLMGVSPWTPVREVDVERRGVGHPHHAATPLRATTGWAGTALRPPARATRPGAGRRTRAPPRRG